jgi:hypothetical protein
VSIVGGREPAAGRRAGCGDAGLTPSPSTHLSSMKLSSRATFLAP